MTRTSVTCPVPDRLHSLCCRQGSVPIRHPVIILVPLLAMVKPAHASGTVTPTRNNYIVSGNGFSNYTTAASPAEACGLLRGMSGPVITAVSPVRWRCTYTYPNGSVWVAYADYISAVCPAHSTGTATCACTDPYVPDLAGTSCVVGEQYTLSEPQDQIQLPDVEPGSSREITARVASAQTGMPKQGAVVRFHLDVDLTSGGHDHGEAYGHRSRGTISSSTCVPEPGGTPDTYDCTTGAEGKAGFTFNAPAASGAYTITATCISHTCSGSKTGKIDVKVNGLWPIPDSKFYTLTEPDGRGGVKVIGDNGNHSGNHYLTPEAASMLWRLAATYYFKYRQDTSVPLLHLNDASLVWGGRFDANGNWADPHAGHRKGTVIDIRANALPTAIPERLLKDFKKLADKTQLADGTSAIAQLHNVGDTIQHYHVILLGVDQ